MTEIAEFAQRHSIDADKLQAIFEAAGWQYADGYLIEHDVPDDDRRALNALLWAVSPRNPNRTPPVSPMDRLARSSRRHGLSAEARAEIDRTMAATAPSPTRPLQWNVETDTPAAVAVLPSQAADPGKTAAGDVWDRVLANQAPVKAGA